MFELVRIATQEEATKEGEAMQHAIGVLFSRLNELGVMMYSMRNGAERVLTISVRHDDQGAYYCDHVVGFRNRPPTEAELMTLNTLLLHHKVQLRYDPMTTS